MLASSVLWKWVCWMCKNGAVVVGQVGSCRGYVMGWSVLGVARYGGCGLVGLALRSADLRTTRKDDAHKNKDR